MNAALIPKLAAMDVLKLGIEMQRFPDHHDQAVDFFGLTVHELGSFMEELGVCRLRLERLRYMESIELEKERLRTELSSVTAERDLFKREAIALAKDATRPSPSLEGQPSLEAIEAQWSEFREYLDPQQAGEECAILGFFAPLIDIARDQRHQLVRLREIEVSEECPRVEQTVMHVPGESRGNCFAAVFAGLLQIPIESIPDFDGPDWRKQVNAFLRPYGLAWLQVGIDKEWLEDSGVSGMWHEVSGTTSRFDGKVRHSCAALDAEVAWDPHPSQSGLEHQNGASIFVALQPWKMARSRLSSSPQPATGAEDPQEYADGPWLARMAAIRNQAAVETAAVERGKQECAAEIHDWRYASLYTKPGFESRARCQRCGTRQWFARTALDAHSPTRDCDCPTCLEAIPEHIDGTPRGTNSGEEASRG